MDNDKLHIAVAYAIGPANVERIKSVSPKIILHNIADILVAEIKGDLKAKQEVDAVLAEAEVLYTRPHRIPANLIARTLKLKWIQLTSAGIDRLLDTGVFRSRVTITNTSGMHAVSISEFVLQLMLMFVKNAPLCFQLKQTRQWKPFYPVSLKSKTVGIIGLGSIGREVARLSRAFGMRVIAIRRSVKESKRTRLVDLLLPPEQLSVLLKESDFVVLSVPSTPETQGLIGANEIRAMKPSAYLINIARGDVVDENALIHALEQHEIAGAGLDVFGKEPLPVESKLWNLPNVILSPHLAGGMENHYTKATDIFCENLERYLKGQRLKHIVSKKKGY